MYLHEIERTGGKGEPAVGTCVGRFESELNEAVFAPGRLGPVRAEAADADGDESRWTWTVNAESTDVKVSGDQEEEPPSFPAAIVSAEKSRGVIRTPTQPGSYRVFGIVRDGKGGASAENFCFRIEARQGLP